METTFPIPGLWERFAMVVNDIQNRMERILKAFTTAGIPHALVGGQAVALWVASRDPAAVRVTKDVDVMINRADLSRAKAAARSVNMDFFEVIDVGMFLEQNDPSPKKAVHLLWAGEKVKAGDPLPSPTVDQRIELEPGKFAVPLLALIAMKLMANRDHDRVHVRDMIDVGLIDRDVLAKLPPELAARLEPILTDMGK